MEALSAFHGASDVRQAALEQLSQHVAAGELMAGRLVWTGQKGSVVGCLVHSGDPQDWQARLGLARWLAHVLDALTQALPPEQALACAEDALQAITPGQDTSTTGSALIESLLADAAALHPERVPSALAALVAEARHLHRRCLGGDSPEPGAWKAVRRDALATTDGIAPESHPHARALAELVEAAAWDPSTSASAVAETLRLWLALQGGQAGGLFGWTDEDDARTRLLLEEMHVRYQRPFPDERRDVFLLLEEHHPAHAARLREYIRHDREYHKGCERLAAGLLIKHLEILS